MLRARVPTALVLAAAAVAAIIFLPAAWFSALVATLELIGLYEVVRMTSTWPSASAILLAPISVGLWTALALAAPALWLLPLIVFGAMAALIHRVVRIGSEDGPRGGALALLGGIFVAGLFPYFAVLRAAPQGVGVSLLVLGAASASDMCAYFVGRALGRNKLLERVSPQKTVEGAIGGLCGSVAVGMLLGSLILPGWTIGRIAILSFVSGLLAQIGDLAGSSLKRLAGVKDSGRLFPGHGGLLDRVSSLAFVAAFAYYYLELL